MKIFSSRTRGFTLLETAITLGISGIMLAGIWQLMGSSNKTQQAKILGSQAAAVAIAAQDYINDNKASILAYAGMSTTGSSICIDVTAADACATTLTSLVTGGYLPSTFSNVNSYGQSYKFYVYRQDSGTLGSADANDRVLGLVLTSGGTAIDNNIGMQVAQAMGAAGGFIYSGDATKAVGTASGWQITLASWTAVTAPGVGHIAALTNLYPMVGNSAGGTVHALNDLSDSITDYSATYNLFVGDNVGTTTTSSGLYNTALGVLSLQTNTTGDYNAAFGYYALTTNSTGNNNTAFGSNALKLQTGSDAAALGFEALLNNTASSSVAVGSGALRANTSGLYNTAVGYQALYTPATAGYNTALGYTALKLNQSTGEYNTAVGAYALTTNTTADDNVAVGASALRSNSTAADNTAVGSSALYSATGVGNTAVGSKAGQNMTSGTYNTFVGGYSAQAATLTGSYNAALGYQSLYSNTSGANNAALGYQALYTNASGADNTAVGYQALTLSSSTSSNTAVGSQALRANNGTSNTAVGASSAVATAGGSSNTAVGASALAGNMTGSENTAIGVSALAVNTVPLGNTAVGYQALYSSAVPGGQYSVAVGYQALYSNTGNYNVGVGYASLYSNTWGTGNTAVGKNTLYLNVGGLNNTAMGTGTLRNVTADGNTAFGYQAGYAGTAITTGTYNTFLGYQAQSDSATYTNGMALGNGAVLTADNRIVLGNTSIASIYAQVTTITGISDRRRKKDIEASDLGLDFIMRLKPVSYRYNNGDDTLRYGFIAQDLVEALGTKFDDLVNTEDPEKGLAMVGREKDKERTYRAAYGELTAPLVKAVQEQQAEIEALKAEIAALKAAQENR